MPKEIIYTFIKFRFSYSEPCVGKIKDSVAIYLRKEILWLEGEPGELILIFPLLLATLERT